MMNHPDLVHPATRKKVELAVEKSGYIRNRAAQAMHGKRSATIGLVVPTVANTIFAEVVQAFNDTVSAQGFTLLLASHGYDLDGEYRLVRKLLEHRVDALAVVGLDHSAGTFRLIAEQRVPLLALWNYLADSTLPCIGVDNREAGRLAAEHLVALGHRRIGMVFPVTFDNDRARDRKAAATAVFRAAGIALQDRWQVEVPYSIAQAKAACLELLAGEDRPSALLCANDVIAQGAIYAAARLGIAIPANLSVIGIGDFAGSAQMEPALTTVRIPARQIGISAGQAIVAAIGQPDADFMIRSRVELELIMRTSTGIAAEMIRR
ncbi:substrate-binding domain-containing protein [Paracoccus sp. TOH]|uniref:LacI family DNA-binding transcriptional regulator n=1 Tax=Paracoccus sp. TOH TaxID=1263728 RepID=UPI0025B0A22E|nr:substrate-binding domain-containing protein [Paracoccus sp. TOH]WJS87074.1 substrate-binding domain-containing protein [Paracoccus sp. TOH]